MRPPWNFVCAFLVTAAIDGIVRGLWLWRWL